MNSRLLVRTPTTVKYELLDNNMFLKEYSTRYGYGYRIAKTLEFKPVKFDEIMNFEEE